MEVEMGELPVNQVLCGDCREILAGFPDNSIDLVVTDPPYGLGFMGKEWDMALPPRESFEQMIRVLKPGALAFVMSSPRQDLMWRMCALLEDVGFELRQSFISWIYRTGFPKAYDVSKGIDRKLGLKREVVGYNRVFGRETAKTDRGFGVTDKYGNGLTPALKPIEPPASDLAKLWDGWKSITGLKPALEPILMANKPFSEPTIVDNVLKWGTGAINVDACRIPYHNKEDAEYVEKKHDSVEGIPRAGGNAYQWKDYEGTRTDGYTTLGRFPANLLVSDGTLDTGEIKKYSVTKGLSKGKNKFFGSGYHDEYKTGYTDEGDQSRYFDLDSWAEHYGFLDIPKPDTSERDYGLNVFQEKQVEQKYGSIQRLKGDSFVDPEGKKHQRLSENIKKCRNTHPTVKPIKLMAYLIELGCPKNGIVLDPFAGTGTTCIAAKQLCRRYIGIEIDEKYHALATARVAAYPQPLEWFTDKQPHQPQVNNLDR